VPFYREAFELRGITPKSMRSLDDLRRLPSPPRTTSGVTIPLGFLTVPRDQLARIHGSSGTTGKPTFVAYTANDLQLWSDLCARFLIAGGLKPQHTVHVAFGYGLFTGGFGLHYGIENVGAAVVPAASGNTRRQIEIIQDLGSEVLICTPSYALTIAETARGTGHRPAQPAAQVRPLRRRALDRGDAPADRGRHGYPGLQQLRPVGGHRPRRLR
jgi:phenylacetate-CoA ligase